MSCSPRAFALYEPTLQVRPSLGPLAAPPKGRSHLKFAWWEERDSPKWKGVVERPPSRQANSHSASVGKRYFQPFFSFSSRAFSFSRKACASFQLTRSTGKHLVSF